MNRVSVHNANDPMSIGQGDVGTILLSPFEDGHYSSHKQKTVVHRSFYLVVLFCDSEYKS